MLVSGVRGKSRDGDRVVFEMEPSPSITQEKEKTTTNRRTQRRECLKRTRERERERERDRAKKKATKRQRKKKIRRDLIRIPKQEMSGLRTLLDHGCSRFDRKGKEKKKKPKSKSKTKNLKKKKKKKKKQGIDRDYLCPIESQQVVDYTHYGLE